MLYTRKGDDGTTKTFGAKIRMSKGSFTAEALGSLDEINTFLGLCKVKSESQKELIGNKSIPQIIHFVQEKLFIVQAEVAGSDKKLKKSAVVELEKITDTIEGEFPPIKSFRIAGGTEVSAIFDIARTLARRAERRVTAACEAEGLKIGKDTRAYLNRLSSALYALARYANHTSGVVESAPGYK
jgi:cob(I)alamin adenosyltransferase